MRRAFTLLEVMVAVAILAGSLVVLVQSQAAAVMMAKETDHLLMAGMLAREKMVEVQLLVEKEGFGEEDLEEEGDFSDFDSPDDLTLDLDRDWVDSFADYSWAYTVRKIELDLNMGGDLGGLTEDLVGGGYWGDQTEYQSQQDSTTSSTPSLSDMGVQSDLITEMLGGFIREVRVLVWWGDNLDQKDQVELVTHVINPTGLVMPGAGSSGVASTAAPGGTSGQASGGSSRQSPSMPGGTPGRGGPKSGGN